MMYYVGTILIVIVYIILFALAFAIGKTESRKVRLVVTFIFGILLLIVLPSEIREAKYSYDLQYTIRLHYIDGYTQVKTFTCRGYDEPKVYGERGSFVFRCGSQEIPAVIRYDVVNKKQIPKEERK